MQPRRVAVEGPAEIETVRVDEEAKAEKEEKFANQKAVKAVKEKNEDLDARSEQSAKSDQRSTHSALSTSTQATGSSLRATLHSK